MYVCCALAIHVQEKKKQSGRKRLKNGLLAADKRKYSRLMGHGGSVVLRKIGLLPAPAAGTCLLVWPQLDTRCPPA